VETATEAKTKVEIGPKKATSGDPGVPTKERALNRLANKQRRKIAHRRRIKRSNTKG